MLDTSKRLDRYRLGTYGAWLLLFGGLWASANLDRRFEILIACGWLGWMWCEDERLRTRLRHYGPAGVSLAMKSLFGVVFILGATLTWMVDRGYNWIMLVGGAGVLAALAVDTWHLRRATRTAPAKANQVSDVTD